MAPSREQMAFMAMMDGIIHTHIPCNCSTCNEHDHSNNRTRQTSTKRSSSNTNNKENTRPTPAQNNGSDDNQHTCSERLSQPSTKKSSTSPARQSKTPPSTTTGQNRNEKVNSLLKAETVQAVFEIFKLTPTTNEEKDLAQKIQNATTECKLFTETKTKILEVCDDEEDLDGVFGLLAKFRHERNLLTTAVIKSNTEREKSLVAIQRVDHLMYMLQDVAKDSKDSKGADVRHNLGNIILEIHELAKTPSLLYDELLDLREEHLDLVADHEEQHQKFMDIESCHEKLHDKNKKLLDDHTKLLKDHAELKKKASSVGGLKNDVTRLEKLCEKNNNENTDLKKEVARLTAELGKVSSLKHENAQLKKKILSIIPAEPVKETKEEQKASEAALSSKKKKGKKTGTTGSNPVESSAELESKSSAHEDSKLEKDFAKLQKSHEMREKELIAIKTNLKQLEALLQKAEKAAEQATEKLQVEKAKSQNWRDISGGHLDESKRLRNQLDQSLSHASSLQQNIDELENSLTQAKEKMSSQTQPRPPSSGVESITLAVSEADADMARMLRKIKNDTTDLSRSLAEAGSYGGDPRNIVSCTRRVLLDIERDLESALHPRKDVGIPPPVPETFTPFQYSNFAPTPSRQAPPALRQTNYSPHMQTASVPLAQPLLPPFRPMMPPGLSDIPTTSPFSRATNEYASATRPVTLVSSSTSISGNSQNHSHTPAAIGTGRPVSNRPAPSQNHSQGSAQHQAVANLTPSPNSTPTPSVSSSAGLGSTTIGNGAAGVDWSMWARQSR